MRNSLALISGLLTFLCVVPYIRDMLRKQTRPNIVTWFSWTLLSGTVTVVAVSDHYWQTAFFTGLSTLGTLIVVLLGLKYGIKQYTSFDACCQILTIIGIVLWRLTRDPAFAVSLVICADLLGTLPTMRHAWKQPYEETWQTFAIDGLAAFLSLFSLVKLNLVAAGYQFYLVIGNLVITMIILHEREALKHIIKTPDLT